MLGNTGCGRACDAQAAEAKRARDTLAEKLAERQAGREEVRARLEREAEAGLKLALAEQDLAWRQKHQACMQCLQLAQTAMHTLGSSSPHTSPGCWWLPGAESHARMTG